MAMDVKMGKMAFAKSPETFEALGVGSCIVITLYDTRQKIGAMAHSAFHLAKGEEPIYKDVSYIEIAIDEMIGKLEALGSKRGDLEAKLAGGANMFAGTASKFSEDNIKAARGKLAGEGIKIAGESTGGNMGRSVEFALDTGTVTVRIKF